MMKEKLKNFWLTIKYLPRRIRIKFLELRRKIKAFYQRGKRGFADCDVWNLDQYLTQVMQKAILKLSETTHGYPSDYDTYEEWIQDLRDIAALITKMYPDDNVNWDFDDDDDGHYKFREVYDKAWEDAELAKEVVFDWMKNHFNDLWD